MTALLDLAERCEKAKGPDRALDAMIHHVIKNGVGVGYMADASHYTASLDAALSLVPEGSFPEIRCRNGGAYVEVYGTKPWREAGRSYAATPALALCAAALRARATGENQ